MKKLFLSLSVLFLLSSGVNVALAAILNPYVVDEKSPVIFGDSVLVGTYFGLENYTHDFVNGYLHITFTYTHDRCCFTSYTPFIYVTAFDPVSTTSPGVKSQSSLLQLYFIHPTDWYLYDIQFDSTGYTEIVKQAGVTEISNIRKDIPGLAASDWAALVNTHPMVLPVDSTKNAMAFTPVPITPELPPPPARTPVIIVPGIMSSYLVREDLVLDNERWPNLLLMSLSPDDLYLNDLNLTYEGNKIKEISPTNLLTKIGDFDFFEGLLNKISENEDVELLPYDWRLSIEDSVEKLKEKIEEVKFGSRSEKINIVAHSMGGLVVKSYLNKYGDNSIEKFVDIATPHEGSPKSFKILNYGDNFGFEKFGLDILNPERTKAISQNMPSVYELLPSPSYGNYLYDLDDFDDNGVKGSLSYADTKEFMKNTGRNALLLDRADAFHQNIDNLNPADYGVKTYNIVGCGTETLDKIFVMNKEASGGIEYNISYVNGDGTVPLKSAEAIPAYKTYYLKNATHALMPSASGVKELVASILTEDNPDISSYPNLAMSAAGCNIPNGRIVSFHSPIELHVYDTLGNHVGPNINGDVENNIPGVSYDIIEGNKFAFLPDGVDYIIKGEATADGTFNARIETVNDERVIETKYFNAVPLTDATQVEVKTDYIAVDNNADGTIDAQVQPSAVLNEVQSGDITKPVTKLDIKGNRVSGDSYISSVQISLSATDDNSGILKTEYSLDSGKAWTSYVKTFVINDRGGVRLMYRSTDKAGNVESVKSTIVNVINPGNSENKK